MNLKVWLKIKEFSLQLLVIFIKVLALLITQAQMILAVTKTQIMKLVDNLTRGSKKKQEETSKKIS